MSSHSHCRLRAYQRDLTFHRQACAIVDRLPPGFAHLSDPLAHGYGEWIHTVYTLDSESRISAFYLTVVRLEHFEAWETIPPGGRRGSEIK